MGKCIGKSKVNQPAVISAYNQGMGGVDMLDRAFSDLRPVIRGENWSWPLVINTLNCIRGTNASEKLLSANCFGRIILKRHRRLNVIFTASELEPVIVSFRTFPF